MTKKLLKPSDFIMAEPLDESDLTGLNAGQPMSYDGDFDDHYTAEDYERRAYARDARDYGYGGTWDRSVR